MKTRTILTACAAFLLAASPAVAQTGQTVQQGQQGQAKQQTRFQQGDLISSDWLEGKSVYSPRQEELGTISNIIMDQKTGKAGYVVLSTGGFFDLSDEKHVVPYQALNIREEEVTMNINKDKLAQAPEWKPNLTMEEFNRETAEFYGVSPVWGGEEGAFEEKEDEGVIGDDEGVLQNDEGVIQEPGGVFEEGGGVIE